MDLLKQKELYTDRLFNGDIEARGFLKVVDTVEDVWCLVLKDSESKRRFVFHDYPEYDNAEVEDGDETYIIPPRDGSLTDGVRFLYKAGHSGSKFAIHNLQTYDRPLIEKIWPKCKLPEEAYIDTFIQSKVQYFDRATMKGARSPHGLDNFARMSGDTHKPKVTDFSIMNAYMLHRCIMDVDIQEFCTKYLAKEFEQLRDHIGVDLTDALEMENEYAKICHKQEVYGTKIDVPHVKKCIGYLDKTVEELVAYIQPQLPPTVKAGTSTKVTRKEMAGLLGYPDDIINKMVDTYEMKMVNGVATKVPIKEYYKPTTKWTIKKKVNSYSGFNISYGESPTYIKKSDLTKWIKENHPDTKPKDWNIEKEEIVTELLNNNTCKYFELEPEDTNMIGGLFTKVKFSESKLSQHEIVKGFLIKQGISWAEEWNLKKDSEGQIMKAEVETTISYPKKASYEDQMHITVKKGEALLTSPKFGNKEYDQLETEIGKDIAKYNTLVHRRRYLENYKDPENKGLLSFVDENNRVPAGVNNFNTATGRASHRCIVNLPSDSAVFGKEMRECIIADEGKEFVGCDQKSSQLSICSFVTNNVDYYNAVATGVEFKNEEDGSETYVGSSAHCVNSRYFNLVSESEWEEAVKTQHEELVHSIVLRRKKSKGLSFASLFGCGAKKLALMGGFAEAEAKDKLQSFLEGMGLTEVIKFLEGCQEKYKRNKGFYIPTAFGYWVFCKGMHKSTNYLIQSQEGAVQKMAVILMDKEIKKRGWENSVNKVLDMHDEVLLEVDEGMGIEVGKVMCDCYTQAGVELNKWYMENLHLYPAGGTPKITCDFAGGYAVGSDYFSCH